MDSSVIRYKANGSLDSTFNGNGIFKYGIPKYHERPYTGVIQPDGKIIVGGSIEYDTTMPDLDLMLVRINADGTLDNTFGTGGKVQKDFYDEDIVGSICLLPDGKFIAGAAGDLSEFNIYKFTSNGSLDLTFNSTGEYSTNVSDNANPNDFYYRIHNIFLQTDGKLVLCGFSADSWKGRGLFVRIKPNGTDDSTFGKNGKIYLGDLYGYNSETRTYTRSVMTSSNELYSLIYPLGNNMGILKIGSNGKVDTTFGTKGVYKPAFTNNKLKDIVLQSDGKLILGGQYATSNFIGRIIVNGTPKIDSTFSNDGFDTFSVKANNESAGSLALQSNGKIIVGVSTGNSFPTTNSIGLARYHASNNVGILNFSKVNALKIAPNPVDIHSNLEFTLEQAVDQMKVELYNLKGEKIKTLIEAKNYEAGTHKISLELPEQLEKGNYIVLLNASSGNASIQITYWYIEIEYVKLGFIF